MRRQVADDLTIAYLAIGAVTAIKNVYGYLPSEVCDAHGGELGFIQAVIGHALMLDRLGDDRDLNGVFVYEVAEPFGERCAAALISGEPFDERKVAAALVDDITDGPR
jgi:hypothetical protein